MKNSLSVLLIICMPFILSNCSKKENIKEFNLSGKAQKGPFRSGSNVTISELDENLNPIGRSFFTSIVDNNGYYELPSIELVSSYIQLKVEGTHYNEYFDCVFGDGSITLYSIIDLSQTNQTNINLLTHLEMDRLVKYKHDGKSFSEAKKLAQKEVLRIFNLDNIDIRNSENLDISNEEYDNGILLAITLSIQGSKDGNALTEFLTNIRNDLKDNGIVDSKEIQTRLIGQARLINSLGVSRNLKNYYFSINSIYEIPKFQNYIDTFLINSKFISTSNYNTPENSSHGINLLFFKQDTIYLDTLNTYSLSMQSDINSKIGFYGFIYLMSGDGIFTFFNNENWSLNKVNSESEFIEFWPNQLNSTSDIALVFKGKGIAKLYTCFSLTDYYIDNYNDTYLKWGY